MYVAEQMGHDVPYMVNIVPGNDESWMFHVPNSGAVPFLARAMGKELRTAVTQGSEESDLDALEGVLSDMDIEGVVTGAVRSDYQWERINMVCDRLGLMVMSPMWRKDQDMLMQEIMDSGIEAIIVGVYAEGMDGSWLGRPIDAHAMLDLRGLRSRHGVSVMGEGGEYESLTLDSPMQRCRLSIDSSSCEMGSMSGTMRVTGMSLVPRDH
jgi:ABC transporter with metal-binding/Fe-S-binding domain ATP-binding protein